MFKPILRIFLYFVNTRNYVFMKQTLVRIIDFSDIIFHNVPNIPLCFDANRSFLLA